MTEPLSCLADRFSASIQHRLVRAVRGALLAVSLVVQFGLSFVPLVGGAGPAAGHGQEAVVFALLGLVGLGGVLVVLCRREVPPPARWAGVTVLLVASALMSATLPAQSMVRVEHWYFGLVGWYGLFLLFDLRLRGLAIFFGAHLALTVAPVLLAGGRPTGLAAMAISAVSVLGFQLGVGMAAGVVRRIAAAAGECSQAEERLRIEEAAAEHSHLARERHYSELLDTAAPLLARIATGVLDPTDPATRRRCAIEAARMRRLFGESDDVSDRLLHELRASIDVAERQGTTVALSLRGKPCPLSTEVRRELLAPISEVLVQATSTARVTVLRGRDRVRLSVVCRVADLPAPSGPSRHVRINRVAEDGQLWMEALWESGTPSPRS